MGVITIGSSTGTPLIVTVAAAVAEPSISHSASLTLRLTSVEMLTSSTPRGVTGVTVICPPEADKVDGETDATVDNSEVLTVAVA